MIRLNTEEEELLKETFALKTESASRLPNIKSVADNTEFILVEGGTKTPHKMIAGNWHKMIADGDSIIRYQKI